MSTAESGSILSRSSGNFEPALTKSSLWIARRALNPATALSYAHTSTARIPNILKDRRKALRARPPGRNGGATHPVDHGKAPDHGNHGSPQLFDVHIYNDAGNSFESAFNALNAQGYQGVPWVIGEAFYNDATEASALRQAVNSTGRKVLYLTEWPETADQSCDPNVNVAPPLDFSNYQAQSF